MEFGLFPSLRMIFPSFIGIMYFVECICKLQCYSDIRIYLMFKSDESNNGLLKRKYAFSNFGDSSRLNIRIALP
jgi:hypothetical protein